MSTLYGVVKFFLGFVLALIILAGGSLAAALYFVTKLTTLPPRPTFANERPTTLVSSSDEAKSKSEGISSNNNATNNTSTPKPLEPGTYRARVIWPDGLILRDRPGYEATSIGGIEFNGEVVVLETTSDKEWERIRIQGANQEGWIKGGNTERIN